MITQRCPRCSWHIDEQALDPDEARYLIFLGMVYRLKDEGEPHGDGRYRIAPTEREIAMLQHGDQSHIDGVFWRITARNPEANVIWLRGKRKVETSISKYESISIDPFIDEGQALEEINSWLELDGVDDAMIFLDLLVAHQKVDRYFDFPTAKKQEIRRRIAESSQFWWRQRRERGPDYLWVMDQLGIEIEPLDDE